MACEQVVVGTPGIVFDCIRKKVLDPSKIVMFVVDEADMMLSTQGYQDQTIQILKWAHLSTALHTPAHLTSSGLLLPCRTLNSSCQLALFSTTWNEDVMNVAASIIPNLYQLKWEEQLPESIKQFYVRCPNEESKFEALANIYGTISIGQTMIFCQVSQHMGCNVWCSRKWPSICLQCIHMPTHLLLHCSDTRECHQAG